MKIVRNSPVFFIMALLIALFACVSNTQAPNHAVANLGAQTLTMTPTITATSTPSPTATIRVIVKTPTPKPTHTRVPATATYAIDGKICGNYSILFYSETGRKWTDTSCLNDNNGPTISFGVPEQNPVEIYLDKKTGTKGIVCQVLDDVTTLCTGNEFSVKIQLDK